MRIFAFMLLPLLLIPAFALKLPAQELRFNQVLKNRVDVVVDMKQDKQGIFWLISPGRGLQRYDGVNLRSYTNEPGNPNSIAAGRITSLFIDADNIIWLGMESSGLERFDPSTDKFTHSRHNAKDATSISNDTVRSVLEDHSGNLWVGTNDGLSLLDRKTGKFTHYRNDPNNPASISHRSVFQIYEDKKGVLWVYSVSLKLNMKNSIWAGALNRFDRATGKWTHYYQDSAKSNSSIPGKRIFHIYEDSKNNFWIVTNAGLYNMDRSTGKCARYYPDPFNSSVLSQTPVAERIVSHITFITEDSSGALWIGMNQAGLNRYDPVTKKSTHFGYLLDEKVNLISAKDTATGFTSPFNFKGISSKDGLFWVSGNNSLYQLNYKKTIIPFYAIAQERACAFYLEDNGKILWIGTDSGLLRKDLSTQSEKLWTNDPKNNNSLINNFVYSIKVDENRNLWLGTGVGLEKFDPVTEKFIHYKNDPKNSGSILDNRITSLFFDHNKNLWASSVQGISRMDRTTGQFTNYKGELMDSSFQRAHVLSIAEGPEHYIWISSERGAFRLDTKTGKFRKYISNSYMKSLLVDAKGIVWAGGVDGLYSFNKAKDKFELFANEESPVSISGVINILEDDQKNIWVSTSSAIIKINEDRTKIKKFTESNGVRKTKFIYNNNFKAADGRIFLGIEGGYFSFYPDQLSDSNIAPQLSITSFKLGERVITAEKGGVLTSPLWQTTEIQLSHDQNVFSFDFFAVDYITPGDEKYFFRLENYDNTWRNSGSEHRAFFFNVPPGTYIFRVKAVSGDGGTAEKSIRIIIRPPWWKTWGAYCLYALLAVIAGYLIFKYQKYYIVKRERERTLQIELAQAKEIEKAYTELKATQAQLIQSEKMASLGELTAGIAHEIQNPLNFVNNFSEINKELIDEMHAQLETGNLQEAKAISVDIKENEEKIRHHGKRADAIVKNMLMHSSVGSGKKEPTDINALAEEYLRLAFHGLRARDKSFNVKLETAFDPGVQKVEVIPQDMGRVLLNLINNALFAVDEKRKSAAVNYEPKVKVSSKIKGNKVLISVSDNGGGIPEKIKDKIFQPFFTTKPSGAGTGLGLSLSYDIVKAHGGEIKVETKENEGTEFIVSLPI